MPGHMLLTLIRTFCSATMSSITLACLLTGLNPTEHLKDTLDQQVRHRNPSHQTLANFLRHCITRTRPFCNALCNVGFLPCVTVVKLSSGLWWSLLILTFCLPLSHISLCIRWIPIDTVSDIYRVIPFPRCLNLWLLVSCLSVLLLNFENQCHSFFLKSIYTFQQREPVCLWNNILMWMNAPGPFIAVKGNGGQCNWEYLLEIINNHKQFNKMLHHTWRQ